MGSGETEVLWNNAEGGYATSFVECDQVFSDKREETIEKSVFVELSEDVVLLNSSTEPHIHSLIESTHKLVGIVLGRGKKRWSVRSMKVEDKLPCTGFRCQGVISDKEDVVTA